MVPVHWVSGVLSAFSVPENNPLTNVVHAVWTDVSVFALELCMVAIQMSPALPGPCIR